jgi:hypothetical protein
VTLIILIIIIAISRKAFISFVKLRSKKYSIS